MKLDEFNAFRSTVTTPSGPVGHADVGAGPVALFLHGAGTNSCLWRGVIDELRGERRCLAVDLPLHGWTPSAPGRDFSLGALAEFVEEYCAALGLDDGIDLVANDTGGAVAQIFAARHPERLRSLTLTNCETHDNVPPEAFRPTVDLAAAGALAPVASAMLENPQLLRDSAFGAGYEHPERVPDELLLCYSEPVFGTPDAAREFERFLVSLTPDDLLAAEPALRRLRVPTLLVWGTADPFFELRWAHWLRDTVPGVTELVEIPGATLFFPDERPQDLVPHLRRHWSEAAADRRR